MELTGIVVTERNLQAALSKEPRVRSIYETVIEAQNRIRAFDRGNETDKALDRVEYAGCH